MLIQNSVEHNDKKFNDDKIKKNYENIFKSNTNKIDLTANHEMKAKCTRAKCTQISRGNRK